MSNEKTHRTYIAIDLKSYYASVECIERGLNPLTTNLVVADPSRTEKTICLAVSPSLKTYGIPGRPRLFEVIQKVKEANALRLTKSHCRKFRGESFDSEELNYHPDLAISYITAPPQMQHYMEYSGKIYSIYLKYIAPEDIHVYSIDEVFMDVTDYLKLYQLTAKELAEKMILDVLHTTGITATAGIGPNLYLCKIAMDIYAKHLPADKNGVRIAQLDEISYREILWSHQPITDFWRVGKGYASKLAKHGLFTMGDIARCSLGKPEDFHNEELLYKLFGINAELLIDHAWGWEPCTMADIKGYRPATNSLTSGQVLSHAYSFDKAKLVLIEMAENLSLDLVSKGLLTNQLVVTVGYDIENILNEENRKSYQGEIKNDYYGRKVPKPAHGTANLERYTSSTQQICQKVSTLFDKIANKQLTVRRLTLVAAKVIPETSGKQEETHAQMDLFSIISPSSQDSKALESKQNSEREIQKTMLEIKKKFGKNAILKAMDLEEGATQIERNQQVGGHKA